MITATFSLVQQLTRQAAMPSVKVICTDDQKQGQIYVPVVNILLLIGTVALSTCLLRRMAASQSAKSKR